MKHTVHGVVFVAALTTYVQPSQPVGTNTRVVAQGQTKKECLQTLNRTLSLMGFKVELVAGTYNGVVSIVIPPAINDAKMVGVLYRKGVGKPLPT